VIATVFVGKKMPVGAVGISGGKSK
jgi:hypothetical protein